jgi:hypothetical protein
MMRLCDGYGEVALGVAFIMMMGFLDGISGKRLLHSQAFGAYTTGVTG